MTNTPRGCDGVDRADLQRMLGSGHRRGKSEGRLSHRTTLPMDADSEIADGLCEAARMRPVHGMAHNPEVFPAARRPGMRLLNDKLAAENELLKGLVRGGRV